MSQWLGEETSKGDLPDLSSAEIVVAGGRALKSAENFQLLYELAEALGNAAGTTPN
jgi:electron transfer flavoprotein alpha subunit